MILLSRIAFPLAKAHIRTFFLPSQTRLSDELHKSQPTSNNDDKKRTFLNTIEHSKDIPLLLHKASQSQNVQSAFSVLTLLSKWNIKEKLNFTDQVEKNIYYPEILETLKKNAHKTSTKDIYYAVENLFSLEVESSTPIVESLQNDLLWHIQIAPAHMLVKIFLLFLGHQKTDMEKEVLKHTVNELFSRCNELTIAWEFSALYEHSHHLSSEFMPYLDDRLLDMAENFTTNELVKILYSLGKSGRRPKPLLRSLSLDLLKKKEPLAPNQICNILYVMCKLNIIEISLLSKLCTDLTNQMDKIHDKFIIGSILTTIGHFHLREPPLMDLFSEWFKTNFDNCSSTMFVNFLLTLAHVSYTPLESDAFFDQIITKLDLSNVDKDSELINIVWSLVVLGKAKQRHISLVIERFTTIESFPSEFGSMLKLLNIDAASSLILNYNGKRLAEIIPENYFELKFSRSKSNRKFNSYVISALENLLPQKKYMKANLLTPMGVVISALALFGKDGKPILLSKYLKDDFSNKQKLPKDVHKVAIMTFDYKDYTIGSQSLIGAHALSLRLLSENGYKVVEIPYWSVDISQKSVKSLAILERKIRKAIEVT